MPLLPPTVCRLPLHLLETPRGLRPAIVRGFRLLLDDNVTASCLFQGNPRELPPTACIFVFLTTTVTVTVTVRITFTVFVAVTGTAAVTAAVTLRLPVPLLLQLPLLLRLPLR